MLRCEKCDTPIDENRIKHFLDTQGKLPEICQGCVPNPHSRPLVFMGPEGKTGVGHLNVVQGDDKAKLAAVKSWHRRGAHHCTCG